MIEGEPVDDGGDGDGGGAAGIIILYSFSRVHTLSLSSIDNITFTSSSCSPGCINSEYPLPLSGSSTTVLILQIITNTILIVAIGYCNM